MIDSLYHESRVSMAGFAPAFAAGCCDVLRYVNLQNEFPDPAQGRRCYDERSRRGSDAICSAFRPKAIGNCYPEIGCRSGPNRGRVAQTGAHNRVFVIKPSSDSRSILQNRQPAHPGLQPRVVCAHSGSWQWCRHGAHRGPIEEQSHVIEMVRATRSGEGSLSPSAIRRWRRVRRVSCADKAGCPTDTLKSNAVQFPACVDNRMRGRLSVVRLPQSWYISATSLKYSTTASRET
jgi:hypothetical protein